MILFYNIHEKKKKNRTNCLHYYITYLQEATCIIKRQKNITEKNDLKHKNMTLIQDYCYISSDLSSVRKDNYFVCVSII